MASAWALSWGGTWANSWGIRAEARKPRGGDGARKGHLRRTGLRRAYVYANGEITQPAKAPRKAVAQPVTAELVADAVASLPVGTLLNLESVTASLPRTLYMPPTYRGDHAMIIRAVAALLQQQAAERQRQDEDDIELLLIAA